MIEWRGIPIVYRCYDAVGQLLYVGATLNWPERQWAHRQGGGWGRPSDAWVRQVAKVKIRVFRSKDDALAHEAEAIRNERPCFNVAGRGPRSEWTDLDYEQVIAIYRNRQQREPDCWPLRRAETWTGRQLARLESELATRRAAERAIA